MSRSARGVQALRDGAILVAAWGACLWARAGLTAWWPLDLVPGPEPVLAPVAIGRSAWMGAVLIPAWLAALAALGAWDRPRRWGLPPWLAAAPVALIGSLAVFDALRIAPASRTLAVGYCAVAAVALGVARARRAAPHRVLLIGTDAAAAPWLAAIGAHPDWAIAVVARRDRPGSDLPALLGTVDEVYLAGTHPEADLRATAAACDAAGVPLSLDAAFLGPRTTAAALHDYGGWPLITFSRAPRSPLAVAVKRALDLGLGAALLIALAPLLAALAAWIRAHDGGPALFVQERVGQHGRRFRMVKLRTMAVGAEARHAELADRNEVIGPAFRLTDDPRVTGPGRFLRRTGLDELPQLLNVLRGEMSLVGPRPPLPDEVARYAPWQLRRLAVPPGITGPWQVHGRALREFDQWVALDLAYVDGWSPWVDLVLLARTARWLLGQLVAR